MKVFYFVIYSSVLIFVIYYLSSNSSGKKNVFKTYIFPTLQNKYIINTSSCKIPKLDPVSEEIKQYVLKLKPMECNNNLPVLSYIEKNSHGAFLKIKEDISKLYDNLNCCMMNITRVTNSLMENNIGYSSCKSFKKEIQINTDTIKIICKNSQKIVYENVHIIALPKMNQKQNNTHKFSVLLIGIDTVSRPALMRTMPKTFEYVNKNFLSFNGYNKVGYNTLPNLGGLLSGKTKKQLLNQCKLNQQKADNCSVIWKNFKSENYVTGYMEDESTISTFNYGSPGFHKAPTDFYGRHYILAAEKLGIKHYRNMNYCTGPENTGERVLNAAKDFVVTYKTNKYFGLFWMNSFSHDDINLPCTMDDKIFEFFTDKKFIESTKDAFIIFFSDHGFRFGDIRFTYTGWLEERMPFIFIKPPDKFNATYSKLYTNFVTNTQRLTNPYDIFLTLQNILKLNNKNYKEIKSEACPNCYSLFQKIPENRTCSDAAIEPHMCICTGYSPINPKTQIVLNLARFVLNNINEIIKASYPNSLLCSLYKLNKVYSAGMSETFIKNNENVHHVLLLIEVIPKAMFEATLEVTNEDVKLVGEVTRLNKYSTNSYCVDGKELKQYCYCISGLDYFKKTFLSFIVT